MPNLTSSYALHELIARMHEPIDLCDFANEEASRIMIQFGLSHPMTLSAALKIVASEQQHGRLSEIEAIAKALHAKLVRRHVEPDVPQ